MNSTIYPAFYQELVAVILRTYDAEIGSLNAEKQKLLDANTNLHINHKKKTDALELEIQVLSANLTSTKDILSKQSMEIADLSRNIAKLENIISIQRVKLNRHD